MPEAETKVNNGQKKKSNGADVIPIRKGADKPPDPFEEQMETRRNQEIERELESIGKRTVSELIDIASYSPHSRLRNKALDLLPDDWRTLRTVSSMSVYPDTAKAAQEKMEALKSQDPDDQQ